MSRRDSRERGVILRKINPDSTVPAFRTRQTFEDILVHEVTPAYGYAVGTDLDGQMFVVGTEGVGWPVRSDKPVNLQYTVVYQTAGDPERYRAVLEVPFLMADIVTMSNGAVEVAR